MNIAILLKTWWRGQLVGQDDYGNRYYLDRKPAYDGRHRRWVIYKGVVEATKVPAEWHGWLHYTTAEPPQSRTPYAWEKPHSRNLTGTKYAYKPAGWGQGKRPQLGADYEPWQP